MTLVASFENNLVGNGDFLNLFARLLNVYQVFMRNEISPREYINRSVTIVDALDELWQGAFQRDITPTWAKRAKELKYRDGVDL